MGPGWRKRPRTFAPQASVMAAGVRDDGGHEYTCFMRGGEDARLHERLSLSRLNHRLPRGQAHPEVVEGAAEFHHEITDARLPQADAVFDNAAALDTPVHMLDPQPPLVAYLVGPLLLQGQLRTAGL